MRGEQRQPAFSYTTQSGEFMTSPRRDEEADRSARASRLLDAVREIGFAFAIAASGVKLVFSAPITFRLGETGREVLISSPMLLIVGVLCLVAAAVIAVQHVSARNRLLPEGHLLRRKSVVRSAWVVGTSVVLFVVLTITGVASPA